MSDTSGVFFMIFFFVPHYFKDGEEGDTFDKAFAIRGIFQGGMKKFFSIRKKMSRS